MKFQVFDPLFKHVLTTNIGLKHLITGGMPNAAHYRGIWSNQLAGDSIQFSNHNAPSIRFFSQLSNAHALVSKISTTSFNSKNAVMCTRTAHNGGNDEHQPSKSVVLYIQNPFRWLVNKLDFGMLRRAWDPNFKEKEFRDGAKLAVSTVTRLMSANNFEDLDGLLTSPAINHLRHEVETKWSDIQRRNVYLTKEDIKVALPQRVRFQRIDERKFCDVDMLFLALKHSRYEGANATIFVEIKVRFHRDYTEGLPPEWTVSMFRVTRFNILPR